MKHPLRRAAALVAAPALAVAALAATPSPAQAAADPEPGAAAAAWLAQQPENGIVSYLSFGSVNPDPGLSIDVGTALQVLGGHDDVVGEIATGVAGAVESGRYAADYSYESPVDPAEPDGPQYTYAGSSSNGTAKALAYLLATQHEGMTGELAERLAGDLVMDGPAAGRLTDGPTRDGAPYPDGDYANILGQGYAVQALEALDSPSVNGVTEYLLGLQCADGSFKESLPAVASATQGCADAPGESSVDATAFAVLSLAAQTDDTDVAAAIDDAVAWLEAHQRADGSFTSGDDFGPNANSTGLATTALATVAASDDDPAVVKGATWVRQHQVLRQDACAPIAAGASGAIAYDDADRATAFTGPLSAEAYGTWLRASAQAAPALRWAPRGTGAQALFTAEYVKAGGSKSVGVVGADPGEQLCARVGDGPRIVRWADAAGQASLPVAVPARTATTKVEVYTADAKVGTVRINALGAKRLSLTLKAKVRTGKKQTVKVSGLAAGESVTVKVLGRTKRGQANARGVFAVSAKATGKQGKAGRSKVVAVGQFTDRRGSKTFKVVR